MAWHKSCQEHWQEATSKLTVIHHLTFHQRYRDQHLYKRFMRWNLPKFATAVSIVDIHPAITRSRKPPASPSWLTRWCRRLGVNWRLFSRYSTGFQKRTRTSGSSSSSVLLSSSYKKGKKKNTTVTIKSSANYNCWFIARHHITQHKYRWTHFTALRGTSLKARLQLRYDTAAISCRFVAVIVNGPWRGGLSKTDQLPIDD